MRVLRRIIAALLLPVLLAVTTAIGTTAAIVFTPPGHILLARIATAWISGAAAGRVEIGKISGNIWEHVVLEQVAIHDSLGNLILSAPRIEASYILPELLARHQVFRKVRVDSLVLHLVRLRANHWNYEKVFHLGEGIDDGKPPPYMAFEGLELTHAFVQIDAPTTPGAPHKPASRNGRAPAQDSVVQAADGPDRVYALTDLNATFASIRLSTPTRDPIRLQITNLQTKLNDPAVTVTQLRGTILTAADTLRFHFDSVSLPASRFIGDGRVRWPHDSVQFDLALDAPRVALRDLLWIQPDFPDWTGKGRIRSKAFSGSRTDYTLDHLVLGNEVSSVTGSVRLQVERVHGLGMRDLDMQLRNTPIDVLRPYMDTLPVSGGMTGHLLADGFLDSLRLGGDLNFADALVKGTPASHLRIDGIVHFGGQDGAVFQQFRLNQSTIALGTINRLVPSVIIPGVLRLNGQLDGEWLNAAFHGTAEHVAPDGSSSRMIGNVRLDARTSVLGLALDADFDQLSFAALRTGYPGIPLRGGLTGHVIANGNLDSLELHANLAGEIGTFSANGRIKVNTPNYGADSLVIDMQRLDVEAVLDTGTSTALNGRVTVTGVVDSGKAPRGTLTVALDRSRFGGATVDAVTGVIHADRGVLTVDSSTVIWSAGRVDALGTLGWAAPDSGLLTLRATATSLAPFDSLVRSYTGMAADTIHPRAFDGQATAALQIRGSLGAYSIAGTVTGSKLVLDSWHASAVTARIRADSRGSRGITIDGTIDTIGVGDHVADGVTLAVTGTMDSLRVAGSVGMMALHGSGGGSWIRRPDGSNIQLDSARLDFPHQSWGLAKPARMSLRAGQLAFVDTLRLRSSDGSGDIRISGAMPADAPGKLDANIKGLDLLDVFGVLDRDSTALDGIGSLDLHLAGTRDAPTFNGTASIISPVIGAVHAPSVLATFDYAGQRLHSTVSLWRTGVKVLEGAATLPLDLALAPRADRKVLGPLQIAAAADSVDMVILAALMPAIANPAGVLRLDLKGSGTWQAPKLEGLVAVSEGGLTIPSLNVRYAPINGVARFVKDSLRIDSMVIGNNDNQLRITGGMRFAELSRPTMDLRLSAVDFLALDVPSFLTMRATGDVRLSGSWMQPVLTGDNVLIRRSVLYFADLITKNVINLEDPAYASLIDTTAIRRRGLGNQFSSRFLDSLRIDELQLQIGSEVWLRSAEANIQLDGDLRVNKLRREYHLSGGLNAPRGTYTLRYGLISRDFIVDQGTVTYFGTADLDANLGIQAHYQVRTLEGDDFNVNASITGSILQPKVTLSSPGRTLSERDLLSYVMFGRSEFQLTGTQQGLSGSLANDALGALFSEFSRSRVNGSGNGLSSFSIRPGASAGGLTSGVTQVAAGLQFGGKWFFTFDAGFCFSQQSTALQTRNFGASLEYRINREFRFQAAAEPVQSCIGNRVADVFTTLNRYQLGWNILWRRDY